MSRDPGPRGSITTEQMETPPATVRASVICHDRDPFYVRNPKIRLRSQTGSEEGKRQKMTEDRRSKSSASLSPPSRQLLVEYNTYIFPCSHFIAQQARVFVQSFNHSSQRGRVEVSSIRETRAPLWLVSHRLRNRSNDPG